MINLDPAMEASLVNGGYTIAHLITIEFVGGTLYYTENYHDIFYNGDTWVANGLLMGMGEPKYTSELRVNETSIEFSAADLTTQAILLNNDQYNRTISVDRVNLDDSGNIIGAPIRMNNFKIVGWTTDDRPQGESVVSLRVASEFADWQKPSGRRTTGASQQRFFPSDKGLEFAASVKKAIKWGAE